MRPWDNGAMESVWPYLAAIIPTLGIGGFFYFIIKAIIEGDRRERLAQAQWERQAPQPPEANSAAIPTVEVDKS